MDKILTFGVLSANPGLKYEQTDRQLNYVLQLKATLPNIENLHRELSSASHPAFKAIHEDLSKLPCQEILKKIHEVIQDEAKLSKGQSGDIQRCFAVKTGLHGLLDVARQTYTEIIDAMREYVDSLTERYSLPFRLSWNARRGYHLKLFTCSRFKTTTLPDEFIQIVKQSGNVTATTMELINFDLRLKRYIQEIQLISNR